MTRRYSYCNGCGRPLYGSGVRKGCCPARCFTEDVQDIRVKPHAWTAIPQWWFVRVYWYVWAFFRGAWTYATIPPTYEPLCTTCRSPLDRKCLWSQSTCGHHCNCIYLDDKCCWCGKKYGDGSE